MSEFSVFYPGQYSEEDQAVLNEYLDECKAIDARGPVDPAKLTAGELHGVPGVGGSFFETKELPAWQTSLEAANFDPENPLYNDEEYARSLGFRTTPLLPLASSAGDVDIAPMPAPLRDNLVISGLNHVVKFHAPLYPGDTIFPVCDHREVEDLTPAGGSELRTFGITGTGSVYNQNGELIATNWDRVKESLRRHEDPAKRRKIPMPHWECPAWWDLRGRHKYTAQDWDFIKSVWAKEPKPHDEPVYWEDVQVGDHPVEYMEAPIQQMDQVKFHALMEMGSPSIKTVMQDPVMSQALYLHEETGEYYEGNGVGHIEDGFTKNHRPCFYNHMPIYFVCRAFQNWMGNKGTRLDTVAWRIMNILPGYEKDVPDFPDPDSYIGLVPELAGKTITTHGMVGDVIWIKSCVTDKYEEDGKKLVKIVYWIQTIEEEIYEEGYVIVELPSKV